MTNVIVLAVSLSTNWTDAVSAVNSGPATNRVIALVESGTVYQNVELGFMEGTNARSIGTVFPLCVGYIRRTNYGPGVVQWTNSR